MRSGSFTIGASTGVLALSLATTAVAQHADVLLQRDGDKIAVGLANFDGGVWSIGSRVFARDFPSDFLIDHPGFNSLSATSPALPPGFSALPASSPVGWDFLPMTIDTVDSNLWYWDGQDTNGDGIDDLDVEFSVLPDYTLTLEGEVGAATADGSDQLVVGDILGTTSSNGALHVHRYFSLDSGDPSTDPADGIYLIAMWVNIESLEASDPFFILFGTPGSTLESRAAAVTWVTDRVDMLVRIGLPGDYNHDGVVDAADYTVWRDSGSDATAFQVWKDNFGQTLGEGNAFAAVASVPEPNAVCQLLTVLLAAAIRRRKCCNGSPAARRTVDANRGPR